MEKEMFCFQCEQTALGTSCTGKSGVCGKKSDIAEIQDKLTGALIGLACICQISKNENENTYREIIKGLFTTITNVSFDNEAILLQIDKTHIETEKLISLQGSIPNNYPDFDMKNLWKEDEDIRSLKSLILFGLKGMAAYAYHALMLGFSDKSVNHFFCDGLAAIGYELPIEKLVSLVMKTGEVNLKCMELLDKANTTTYGIPFPVKVSLTIEKGPFIVITGHDFKDLELLLKQTKYKGINIYTHGEMLPAHAYPGLKKYKHLKGNFGTAWQNQQKEFDNIPGAILFTTNCLMPPRPSYIDRVFTTEVVDFPGTVHIGENKDFTPVIKKALDLGGYSEQKILTGINGGTQVTTGYGHSSIVALTDRIVKAVNKGEIQHFFLVGGCDGAKPGRNYYTEFVKLAPKNTIILTLACGKYRFNDLDLGTVAGIPRILDVGQCNDAYGAIQVALALSKAFNCDVNKLPLSFVLSWYEQKAVCILLTLLHLRIKNIRLGPSLPAFISPTILKYLVDNFGIAPITTPEKDLEALLKMNGGS